MGTPIWALEGVALESDADAVVGSLAYRVLRMYDDKNEAIKVYPTLEDGATVVSAATDWGLGALATLVPVNTIAADFLVQSVIVESMSKNGVYELVLYHGADDDEVARIRFSVVGGFFGNTVFAVPGALVPADARVRAALACSDGLAGAATATISIAYREVI